MKEFLKKDLTLKIISIVFAVFLWFTINPVKTNYYTVPLKVINEESLQTYGLVLNSQSYQKYVQISVRDRGDILNNIKDSDFEVTLDLSKVKSIDDKVVELDPPVYLGREKININTISLKPKTITLDLGKIEENPFGVQIETFGKLPAGYEIISKSAAPDTVSIQAVDSLLNSVGSVKAYVDVTGLDRSLKIRKQCTVYDKNGQEIPDLGKQLTVDITIEIGKKVPIIPITDGKIGKDYIEGTYTVKPDKVLITGSADLMAGINEIKTEPIPLDGETKTFTKPALLQLPDGIKLVSSSREVNVTVQIIALAQQTFELKEENMAVNGKVTDNTLEYKVKSPVSVTLKGVIDDLNKVTVDSLAASIDVTGLEEGNHEVPLNLSLPVGITQVEDIKVQVEVTKAAQ